jgi:hypothetical protein
MKFIFLKSGDYLELEPSNTPIASAWFDNIFLEKMNMSYFAKGTACIGSAKLNLYNLQEALKIVNQFATEKNLPQLLFPIITGLDQTLMNALHKQWVKRTNEFTHIVHGDDIKEQYPAFAEAWQNINTYIHLLENYYSIFFSNSKDAYLGKIDAKIRPEDCEYSQHDLLLSFQDLGRHQFDQWQTGSAVDEETSNYRRIPARFDYIYHPQLIKGLPPNPAYVEWCKQNNLQVMPPWIILGNFKKDRWEVKQLMHQNLSQGLEVGFEV